MDTDPTFPEDDPGTREVPPEPGDSAPKSAPRRRRSGRSSAKPSELLEPPVQVHRQWATSDYRWQETLHQIPTRGEVYDRFGSGKYRLDCQGGGRVYWTLQRRPEPNALNGEPAFMDTESPADQLRAALARNAELERKLDQLAAAAPSMAPGPPAAPAQNPWAPPQTAQPGWPGAQPAPAHWPPPAGAHHPSAPPFGHAAPGPPPGYVWHPSAGWIPMPAQTPQFAPGPYHPTTADPLAQLRQFSEYKRLMDELWPDGVGDPFDGDDDDDEPADIQTMITNGIRDMLAARMAPAAAPAPAAPAPAALAPVPPPPVDVGQPLPGETAEHTAELAELANQLGQDPVAVRAMAHSRGYTADQAVIIGRQLAAQAAQTKAG